MYLLVLDEPGATHVIAFLREYGWVQGIDRVQV